MAERGVDDGRGDLDAVAHVAVEPVGGGDEHASFAVGAESPYTAVLEVVVDEASEAYVEAEGLVGHDAADASGHDFYFDAGEAGFVEVVDEGAVLHAVHFECYACVASGACDVYLACYEFVESWLHVEFGDEEFF